MCNKNGENLEKCLIIIKPDVLIHRKLGKIISSIENTGVKIISMRLIKLDKNDVEKIYTEHKQKEYYHSLISSFLIGPCVILIVIGKNCIYKINKIKYIIRNKFSINGRTWAVMHASSSEEETEFEIKIFKKYIDDYCWKEKVTKWK